MKRLLGFVVVLAVVSFGLGFAVINADPVRLNYYLGSIQAPLSLVVVLAVVLGAALGILASLTIVLVQRREIAKLHKKIGLNEKEIKNLRELPLRDKH